MSVIIPKDCFHQPQVADLRLIACPGAEELTNLIDKHLVRWASEAGYQTDSFIIESAGAQPARSGENCPSSSPTESTISPCLWTLADTPPPMWTTMRFMSL